MTIISFLGSGLRLRLKGLAKAALRKAYRRAFLAGRATILEAFLAGGATIDVPPAECPELTAILVLQDGAELTFQCLSSLLAGGHPALEIVIVDNASTDGTKRLLGRVRNVKVLTNESRLSYARACGRAVEQARGEYLLFLDPDAQVLGESIISSLRTMKSSPDIGVVGGKTILPDGKLQEAGSILWRDGSRLAYGQGDHPFAPAYMFQRDVDGVSGAFLLTRRDLFEANPFDEADGDAGRSTCEKVDYCIRLWKAGWRTVYDPGINALRLADDDPGPAASRRRRARDRTILVERHRDWLAARLPPSQTNILRARSHRDDGRRILFIEDRIPHPSYGSGDPRSNRILVEMPRLGYFVTFYPTTLDRHEGWLEVYRSVDRRVEVMTDHGGFRLEEFLKARDGYYDLFFVSRPNNMEWVRKILSKNAAREGPGIVYDAEALYCLRTIGQLQLSGSPPSAEHVRELIDREVRLAEGCAGIVSVSDREGRNFMDHGLKNVYTLGHTISPSPSPNPFEKRGDLLFVGAIYAEDSPNADSVAWFIQEIFPRIREKAGCDIKFFVVGTINSAKISGLADESVVMTGKIEDLAPIYNRSRLFVAPTRFAAGIPIKVQEAAAHGLPVVTTPLLAEQLGWRDGDELLVADSPESFADQCLRLYRDGELWGRLRANALDRVKKDYSQETFSATLGRILEESMRRAP
jgi:GT2 family glycosyltransferase